MIVQDRGGGVMRRQQRFELRLVGLKAAVQIERRLAERDADLANMRGIDLVLLHQIEQSGVQALNDRRRRPEPQRDLFKLETLPKIGDRESGLPPLT